MWLCVFSVWSLILYLSPPGLPMPWRGKYVGFSPIPVTLPLPPCNHERFCFLKFRWPVCHLCSPDSISCLVALATPAVQPYRTDSQSICADVMTDGLRPVPEPIRGVCGGTAVKCVRQSGRRSALGLFACSIFKMSLLILVVNSRLVSATAISLSLSFSRSLCKSLNALTSIQMDNSTF